jgi:hypothetical protein
MHNTKTIAPELLSAPDAISPTSEMYGALESAYLFFNTELFGGALPPCLITLQRRSRRTLGYFCGGRFANGAGKGADEIALNPRHLKHRSFLETTSTLVHEMVHLWQHHFGHPSRSGYHNKEWAGEMLRLGLHPSHAGHPGGRMTGQQMTHFMIPGGRFESAAKKLRASPLAISWFDADGVFLLPAGVDQSGLARDPDKSGRRAKFVCPGPCKAQAWGKPSLNLYCLDCELALRRA